MLVTASPERRTLLDVFHYQAAILETLEILKSCQPTRMIVQQMNLQLQDFTKVKVDMGVHQIKLPVLLGTFIYLLTGVLPYILY